MTRVARSRALPIGSANVIACLLLVLAACDKPSTESCRKAVENMQRLLATEDTDTSSIDAEVRRCTGGSSKAAVECAANAKTLAELRACDFYKGPATGASGSAKAAPSGSGGSAK